MQIKLVLTLNDREFKLAVLKNPRITSDCLDIAITDEDPIIARTARLHPDAREGMPPRCDCGGIEVSEHDKVMLDFSNSIFIEWGLKDMRAGKFSALTEFDIDMILYSKSGLHKACLEDGMRIFPIMTKTEDGYVGLTDEQKARVIDVLLTDESHLIVRRTTLHSPSEEQAVRGIKRLISEFGYEEMDFIDLVGDGAVGHMKKLLRKARN